MTSLQILKANRDQVLAIMEKHGACEPRVFGSVARGEDGEESDVDFLIKTAGKTSPWFPAGLIQELEGLLGRRVEVVTEQALHWYVRDRILSECRPV